MHLNEKGNFIESSNCSNLFMIKTWLPAWTIYFSWCRASMKASSFSWISRTFSGGNKKIPVQIPITIKYLRTGTKRKKTKNTHTKTMNKNMQTQTKINAVITITLSILLCSYRGLRHFSTSEKKETLPCLKNSYRYFIQVFYDYPANLIIKQVTEGIQY